MEKVQVACEFVKQNPSEENFFRQFRLNQLAKQAVRWMSMDNVLVFPSLDEEDKYNILPYFWILEKNVDLRDGQHLHKNGPDGKYKAGQRKIHRED